MTLFTDTTVTGLTPSAPQRLLFQALGMDLNWEDVLEIAGEAAPGRPHIARALLNAGHVQTFREAFARYLGE